MATINKYLLLFICTGFISTNSVAETQSKWLINADIVNIRSAPTTESDVLIKLAKGSEVTEIDRQDEWVQIVIHRDDFKSGWVHGSLLARAKSSTNTSSNQRLFDRFNERFNLYKDVYRKQTGEIYYLEATDIGNGALEITVTENWLAADQTVRDRTLAEVFAHWQAVHNSSKSLSIHAIGKQGEQYSVIMR